MFRCVKLLGPQSDFLHLKYEIPIRQEMIDPEQMLHRGQFRLMHLHQLHFLSQVLQ